MPGQENRGCAGVPIALFRQVAQHQLGHVRQALLERLRAHQVAPEDRRQRVVVASNESFIQTVNNCNLRIFDQERVWLPRASRPLSSVPIPFPIGSPPARRSRRSSTPCAWSSRRRNRPASTSSATASSTASTSTTPKPTA